MTEARTGSRGSAAISAMRDVALVCVALLQAILLFVAAQASHRFDVVEDRVDRGAATQVENQQRITRLEAQYEEIQRSLGRIEKALEAEKGVRK